MKTKLILPILAVIALAGCRKDIDRFDPYPHNPQELLFTASAFVEVVDINGAPQENAQVRLGNEQLMTNADGFVFFNEALMGEQSYLTVDKAGFFHGSRRFYPSVNKTHYLKVTLLSSHTVGSFDAAAGGTVAVDGSSALTFPDASIVDMSGEVYSGTVDVAAQSIHADDPELSTMMPGDLVGINGSNIPGSLASLGMMAVELRTPSGEPLQVREGSQVEMRMQIPADMEANAPSTIPMWYFDEVEGLWIEEGIAEKNGNEYVASVGHFTYWNYDAWFPIVKWGATFLLPNGEPAANLSVCITILELEATKCSPTNEEGIVCGMVAEGELLLMEVKDQCGNVIYSEEIGPYYDTTMIGPITLDPGTITINEISGTALNCDGNPVTNGFAVINAGNGRYFAELDEVDGSFSADIINCNDSDVEVTVFDEDALKQSLSLTFASAPVIETGTIPVCETLQEYILIEIEGDSVIYFDPKAYIAGQGQEENTAITVNDSSENYFYLMIMGTSEGTYDDTMLSAEIGFATESGLNGYVLNDGLEVVISYYGDPGDYITGTITGFFKEWQQAPQYPFTGEFSVLRE